MMSDSLTMVAALFLLLTTSTIICQAAVLKWKPGAANGHQLQTDSLQTLVHKIPQKHDDTRPGYTDFRKDVECDVCKVLVTVISDLTEQHKSKEEIASEVAKACVDLKIEDQRVCSGIAKEFKEEVVTVFAELVLSTDEICGLLVGDSCGSPYNPLGDWNVTLPNIPKPPVVPPQPPKSGSPQLRVLHLTDIHIDLQYKAGSNAQCGEPLCCREDNGKPVGEPAGRWGDYRNCDLPPWTLDSLFQHLSSNGTFDYILWTGDLPGHNVWNQSRQQQLQLLDYLSSTLDKYFPHTPVYSALGNHESAPVDSFPPPFVRGNDSIDWLYGKLATQWTKWLPKDTQTTINRGAFYTVLLRPGFRLVSINTNYCDNRNFWLYINSTDPAGQLQWLVGVLQQAEDHGEKVHIIGHIPPAQSTCLKSWSWNYYDIVNRYESTIAAQFFGHTHHDSVALFYDPPSTAASVTGEPRSTSSARRATSVAYVAPSVTTYSGLNPAYRIYTTDGFYTNSSWAVLDHETYILNLTQANQGKQAAVWQKEYSAKASYNMSSLFPRDWHELLGRLQRDDTLMQQYYRFYYHEHPPAPQCDVECRRQLLCDYETGRSHDPDMCRNLNVSHVQRDSWLHRHRLC